MAAPQIITPKPPLNLFESKRITADDQWQTIYTVPEYVIPAVGAEPQRVVPTAAIMTGMIIAHTGTTTRRFSAQILDANGDPFQLVHQANVFPNDILIVSLERQVMQSGEALQVQMTAGETADVHFTYILNTRETFEEIV